jgi:hypothetical protein
MRSTSLIVGERWSERQELRFGGSDCMRAQLMQRHRTVTDALGQNDVGPRLGQGPLIHAIQRLTRRRQCLDLTVDIGAVRALRIDSGAHHYRNTADGQWIIALVADADERVGQPERYDDLGCAWHERADSHISVLSCGRP